MMMEDFLKIGLFFLGIIAFCVIVYALLVLLVRVIKELYIDIKAGGKRERKQLYYVKKCENKSNKSLFL